MFKGLLIIKLKVYKLREKKFININKLIAEMWKVKRLERKKYLKWLKKKQLALQKMAPNRQHNFNSK